MDLRDSPSEAAFRGEARDFLETHAPKDKMDMFGDPNADEEAGIARARAWQKVLYANGWAAVVWPKEYGGRGLGPIEQIIWNQESAKAGLTDSIYVVGIGMAGPTIIAHGNDAQKTRYLDKLLRGEEIWCQLFSEPGAGSDLAGLATRGVRDGDEWVVTGQKTWCSGAQYGDFGIVLVRTNTQVPKHEGITFFLLDMKSPGIEVRPLRQVTGNAHFNEVFLNEVRIPDENRLGPEGAGWGAAMTTLMNERMAMGGVLVRYSFDELLAHVSEYAANVSAVERDDLAKLYIDMKSLELLNARIITKLGRGVMPDAESSVMKLALARILMRGGDLAVRILGPDAMRGDGPWQSHFLQAPAFRIAGGTDEIQKTQAAERVLGLPREPRADKGIPFEELPRS